MDAICKMNGTGRLLRLVKPSTEIEGNLDAASLLRAFKRFDTLVAEYNKSRQAWKQDAGVDILVTVQSAEAIKTSVSAQLNRIEQILVDSTTNIAKDYEEHVRGRRAQAATVLIKAGIQMEILRLMEMRVLLPEYLWIEEKDVLDQLGEILSRSQTDCRFDDYVSLQKASFRILERVFRSFLSESKDTV
ncbi:hypothetical protein F5880DRAFT_1512596 [Lentinula raphanica]|nr:hypothetical protein F5880DRAFT_1512596 [Lentinula raphanica]